MCADGSVCVCVCVLVASCMPQAKEEVLNQNWQAGWRSCTLQMESFLSRSLHWTPSSADHWAFTASESAQLAKWCPEPPPHPTGGVVVMFHPPKCLLGTVGTMSVDAKRFTSACRPMTHTRAHTQVLHITVLLPQMAVGRGICNWERLVFAINC